MRRAPGRAFRHGWPVALATAIVVALLLSLPAPSQGRAGVSVATIVPSSGTVYTVTWNGVDVSSAGSASSALTIDLTQSANLLYSWTSGSPAKLDISDARVQMFYFGYAVATRDVTLINPTPQNNGTIPLNWTPLTVSYLLEGLYKLTASMIATNGTTMWSENFYVRDNAPYGVLAVLPIVLLIIMVYEVYELARSGPYAMIGRKAAGPPPAEEAPPPAGGSPPSAGSGDSSSQAPSQDASSGGTPPAAGGGS